MIQHLTSDIGIQPAQVKDNEFKRHGSNRRKPAAPKSRNVLEHIEKSSPLCQVDIPSESYNCDKCFFKTTSLWHFQLHTQHHLTESDNSASVKLDLSPTEDLSENDSDEQVFDIKDKNDKCNFKISPDSRAENCSIVQNRKRHYNVEVDPAKYRRIEDPEEGGVKYACSICGNVYKWRKSLNKHWKEKHKAQHPPPLDAPVKIRPKSMTNKTHSVYKNGHSNQMTHPAFMSHACIMPSMTWQNPFFMMPPQEMNAFDNVCAGQQFYVRTNKTETKANEDAEMKCSDDHSEDAIPLDLSTKKEKEKLQPDSIKTEPNENSNSIDVDVNENRTSSSPTSTDKSGRSFSNENNDRLNRNDYSNGGHNKPVINAYGQKLFVCSVCKAKFLVLDSINDHFLQNHMQELEREIAGKSPPRNTNVAQQNEEWNLSDPKNPLKCIKCDFVGRWPTELQKHAASHSTSRPFKCLVCSLTYKWRWDLAKHFDRAHPSLVNPYKKRDRDAARSMIERTSKDSTAAKKRRLDSPLPVRPQVIVNPCYMPRFVPFAPYPVSPFPFPFVNSSLFEQHCKSDSEAVTYKVDQKSASRTESNESDAESSVKSCSNTVTFKRKCDKEERNYICKWCDFRGRWRSELIQHMRCHHAREKPYHCSECTYASNWKWDVQKHVKKQHPAEDAKIIEIPDRLLFQSDDENLEDKSNYDEDVWRKIFTQVDPSKVMKCNHCPFMTSSPVELRRHLIVHSDEQPYRCFACIYKSKWKCEVKKHMKLHGHTGPILVGRKAMQKVIEKLGSKMKNVMLLDNVKQAGNDDDYITDEEMDKSNMDEIENSTKEMGTKEELNTYDCTNGEVATNGYTEDAVDAQDEVRCRCFVCDYSHEDIEELKNHVHKEHENEMWPCSYCQVQSRTLEEAQLHFGEHDAEEKDYLSTIFLSNC